MTEVLHAGLTNDAVQEAFPTRDKNNLGYVSLNQMLPRQYAHGFLWA